MPTPLRASPVSGSPIVAAFRRAAESRERESSTANSAGLFPSVRKCVAGIPDVGVQQPSDSDGEDSAITTVNSNAPEEAEASISRKRRSQVVSTLRDRERVMKWMRGEVAAGRGKIPSRAV